MQVCFECLITDTMLTQYQYLQWLMEASLMASHVKTWTRLTEWILFRNTTHISWGIVAMLNTRSSLTVVCCRWWDHFRSCWAVNWNLIASNKHKCNYTIYQQHCIYIHVLIQNCEFSPVRFSSSNECNSACTPYMFSTISVKLLQLCDFGATKITVPFTGSSTKMAGLMSQMFSATTVKLVGWLFKHLKPYT